MKKLVLGFVVLAALCPAVQAEEESVGSKVGRGIDKGAQATAKGIEKGADATGKGVNKAVEATGRGFKKADDWLSDKLHLKSRGASGPATPAKNQTP